jgi:hypothetical protein
MAKLPHTSETAIAITFLVMNLSALLRQVFWIFLCRNQNSAFFGHQLFFKVILLGLFNNNHLSLLQA